MMRVHVLLLALSLVAASSVDMVEVSGCPLTEEEANIAEYVAERNTRIQGGDIKRQIEAKTYTVDSLSLEIYQWWVQLGLAGQGSSIAQFVQIMRTSKAQSPSPSFVNVALGWPRKGFDAATGGQFALIEDASTSSRPSPSLWRQRSRRVPPSLALTSCRRRRTSSWLCPRRRPGSCFMSMASSRLSAM